jgi:hypothetical protein
MPQAWPSSLPQQFEKDGYSDAFGDNRIATQPDLGPALIRSRISSMPRPITGVMMMDHDQLVRLRQFWRDDTLDGKLPFNFPDPVFGYGWRRNWLPNSGTGGAVTGSPGHLPTGWSGGGTQNGIIAEVAEYGTVSGLPYVDLHYAGTGTGAAYNLISFSGSIPAVSGETWTQSLYMQLLAGSKTNVLNIGLVQYDVPSTTSHMVDVLPQLSTLALAQQRYTNTWTPQITGLTGLIPRLVLWAKPGIFMDMRIRIGGPQMEKVKSATDFMLTPNTANPIARFRANGGPPQPVFLGGESWAVNLELEIFET